MIINRIGSMGSRSFVHDYQIAASADDGFWSTIFNSDAQWDVTIGAGLNAFFRWTGVTIPTGAVITSAYISVYYNNHTGTPPTCPLKFVKAANPAAPTSVATANALAKTTASISFTPPTSGTWKNSGDIKNILNELLEVPYSYAAGAAMICLILDPNTAAPNFTSVIPYDGNPTVAAKLHIEGTL